MKIICLKKLNCNPCKMVENYLLSNDIETENYDVFENPEVAGQYDISSVPVTILLDDNDNEIKRSIGFKPEELDEIIGLKRN